MSFKTKLCICFKCFVHSLFPCHTTEIEDNYTDYDSSEVEIEVISVDSSINSQNNMNNVELSVPQENDVFI